MAEPKRKPKGKGGRPRLPDARTRPTISLKRSPEWRDWLNKLASHCNMPASVAIDQALKMYAKASEFPDPMPPR